MRPRCVKESANRVHHRLNYTLFWQAWWLFTTRLSPQLKTKNSSRGQVDRSRGVRTRSYSCLFLAGGHFISHTCRATFAEKITILYPPSLKYLPSLYFLVGTVYVLPKYDSSTDLFPLELMVLTLSWCSSVKILLPGLARFQQLHSSAERTQPQRIVARTERHWLNGGIPPALIGKRLYRRFWRRRKTPRFKLDSTRRCFNIEQRMPPSASLRHGRERCGII